MGVYLCPVGMRPMDSLTSRFCLQEHDHYVAHLRPSSPPLLPIAPLPCMILREFLFHLLGWVNEELLERKVTAPV
jgi:hypothetical protein